jgi:hypothetical protein
MARHCERGTPDLGLHGLRGDILRVQMTDSAMSERMRRPAPDSQPLTDRMENLTHDVMRFESFRAGCPHNTG